MRFAALGGFSLDGFDDGRRFEVRAVRLDVGE